MYWPAKMSNTIRRLDVRTSFMQRLPLVTRNHQPFLLLYPLAFESFDLSDFDVVISNSSAFCKGVVTPPGTLHICYCLTPMRWVWNYHAYAELKDLYARCRGLVFPGEEDFGIAPLEANASGRPVIAYAAGGALDTVVDGQTGVLFHEQRVECLMEAVKRAETISWDPAVLRAQAEKFDRQVFLRELREFVDESVAAHKAGARFA